MEPFIPVTASALATGSALITLLLLLALLIQKEIAGGLAGERAHRLTRALNVTLAPLLIVCVSLMIMCIVALLSLVCSEVIEEGLSWCLFLRI